MKYMVSMFVLVTFLSAQNFVRDRKHDVVLDTDLHVMWQDNVDVKWRDMSYDDAREYCNTMQLAGYDDWRLPKLSTLKRIVVSENYPMTIVNVFENSASEYYWSVSSYQKKYAWMISFRDGSVEYYHKTDTNYVRCVRDYSPSQ